MNKAANDTAAPQRIIETWFFNMRETIQKRDLDAHMQLVAERVRVYGMPSKAVIDYAEWRERRRVEFSTGELAGINYELKRIISSMPRRLTFSARENLIDSQRRVVILDKIIVLEKEDDQHWRVVEETIKEWKVKKYQLP